MTTNQRPFTVDGVTYRHRAGTTPRHEPMTFGLALIFVNRREEITGHPRLRNHFDNEYVERVARRLITEWQDCFDVVDPGDYLDEPPTPLPPTTSKRRPTPRPYSRDRNGLRDTLTAIVRRRGCFIERKTIVCSSTNCRCRKGHPHSGAYLRFKQRNRLKSVHIPKGMVADIEQAIAARRAQRAQNRAVLATSRLTASGIRDELARVRHDD
jgi:hypothetical protein